MAVFVAAGDDSEQGDRQGLFLFGGFVAPSRDWIDWFAPAWQERVLNGPPALERFHMAEMASPQARVRLGLTDIQAESRIDEAVRVIRSMGSLHPICSKVDGRHFRDVFRGTQVSRPGPQPGVYPLEPDHNGYLGFALAALHYVHSTYPDAEKVDFVIEYKTKVAHRTGDFHAGLGDALRAINREDLIPLVGGFSVCGKERVPLQAADCFLWHMLQLESGECPWYVARRLNRMLHDRTINIHEMSRQDVDDQGRRAKKNAVPSPFAAKRKRA